MATVKLFELFPQLRDQLAHVPLADGTPTPLQPMSALGEAWGLRSLHVKREDLSATVYGGNKVRKLEWILADARARGHRAVITFGARGSHHCLATALYAAQLGLRATLLMVPQPSTPHVEQTFEASRATGARIIQVPSPALLPMAAARGAILAVAAGEGRPYWIAGGGSDELGMLGCVEAGLEISQQVRAGMAPVPDYIYVAAGSCGTMVGLSLGLWLGAQELPELRRSKVIGVRTVPRVIANDMRSRQLRVALSQCLTRAGVPVTRRDGVPMKVLTGHLGRGYGHPTEDGERTSQAARDLADLYLEPTYTAKALAGLRAYATDNRQHQHHLFVHTCAPTQPTKAMR